MWLLVAMVMRQLGVAHAVVHYLQEQLLAMSHSTHEFSSHRTENTVHLPAGLDMCSY